MNLFEALQNFNKENVLLEMANVLGKNVKTDTIDFSFFFSSKQRASHGIRVKIIWNRNSTKGGSIDGYFEMHGDYKYVESPNSKKIKEKYIDAARDFLKKYKVLFAAVWEDYLEESILQDYFCNHCIFKDVIIDMWSTNDDANRELETLYETDDLVELENIVRKYKLFNMND